MKICTRCNIKKELIEFYRDYRTKDKYRSECKICSNERSRLNESEYTSTRRKYRQNNPDKVKQTQRSKYIKNKEKILQKNSEYRNSFKYKFISYKSSAKRRKIIFELSEEEFKEKSENKNCYYCGDYFDSLGVDRKDSSIGYTLDNTVSCCSVCNRIKNIYSEEVFLEQIQKIYNNKF